MRIDDELRLSVSQTSHYQDRTYSAEHVAAILDGAGGGGTARVTQTASYGTDAVTPTVYYTALLTDGSVLTARTTSGIVLANGLYHYAQDTTGLTDFLAVWDEGDPAVYVTEWIVVDT